MLEQCLSWGHDVQVARKQLERVLASPGFARNERLSRFLRFLVEKHVEGRHDDIKESVIAVEVFRRSPDYDSKQDSIVRTEATRLRARLREYSAGDGKQDEWIIELPKGLMHRYSSNQGGSSRASLSAPRNNRRNQEHASDLPWRWLASRLL